MDAGEHDTVEGKADIVLLIHRVPPIDVDEVPQGRKEVDIKPCRDHVGRQLISRARNDGDSQVFDQSHPQNGPAAAVVVVKELHQAGEKIVHCYRRQHKGKVEHPHLPIEEQGQQK